MSKEYTGNYLNNSYDPAKRFKMLFQKDKPLSSVELNQIQDVSESFIKQLISANFPTGSTTNDGFKVVESSSPSNNFTIKGGDGTVNGAGVLFIDGYILFLKNDIEYINQNATGDLSDDNYSKSLFTPLTTPDKNRTDEVYVDFYFAEVRVPGAHDTEYFDPLLYTPGFTKETTARLRMVQDIKVAEDQTIQQKFSTEDSYENFENYITYIEKFYLPNSSTIKHTIKHYIVKIATLNRTATASITNAMITDNRILVNSNYSYMNGTARSFFTQNGSIGIGTTNPLQRLDIRGNTIVSGNVGIGTENPSKKLDVIGDSYISGNVGIGTENPSKKLDVIGDSYISGNVGIGTENPSKKLDVIGDSYISGNVGIGTENPQYKLHTVGDVGFTGTLQQGTVPWDRVSNRPDPSIQLTGGITGIGTMTDLGSVTISTTVTNDSHTHDERYYTETESDNRFVNVTGDSITGNLNVSGNVGIGTLNPSAKLHIIGDAIVSNNLTVNGTTTIINTEVTTTDMMKINQEENQVAFSVNQTGSGNSATVMEITNAGSGHALLIDNGNVGIGITNPLAKLHVIGDFKVHSGIIENKLYSDVGNLIYQLKNDGGTSDLLFLKDDRSLGGVITGGLLRLQAHVGTQSNTQNSSLFKVEKITGSTIHPVFDINSWSGNVGIGTTNPTSKLHVVGDILTTGKVTLGAFASLQTNTGSAWLGRAYDEALGSCTIQLGGIDESTSFRIVDRAWTKNMFSVSGNAPNASLYINSTGTVNIGNFLDEPWNSNLKVLQIGSGLSLLSENSNGYGYVRNNSYLNTSGQDIARYTGGSIQQSFNYDSVTLNIAPSVTAGNVLTYVEKMKLTSASLSLDSSTAVGAIATPFYINLGKTYSNNTLKSSCKLHLYNSGVGEVYGFGVGSNGDVQYHSGVLTGRHDFYIGDVFSMTIRGTKVGIGITNPSDALHVIGNSYSTGITYASDSVQAHNSSGQGTYIGLFKGQGSLPGYPSNYYPTLKTDYTYLYFSVGGVYVGNIGVNNGYALFDMYDNNGVGKVHLDTNGNSYFTGGNVGIGITNPGVKFAVVGNSYSEGRTQIFYNCPTSQYSDANLELICTSVSGSKPSIGFHRSGEDAMTLLYAGGRTLQVRSHSSETLDTIWTSGNLVGIRDEHKHQKLWRSEESVDYYLSNYWTGYHWYLQGFNSAGGYHGEVRVGYADSSGNADTVDGLHVHSGVNNVANQIVRTDGYGHIQAGWINTVSSEDTAAFSRIYASYDGYIRYYSPTNFINLLGLWTSANLTGIRNEHSHQYLYSTNTAGYIYPTEETYYIRLTGTKGVIVAYADTADTVDGLHVHSGINNEADKIVRTNQYGDLECGAISTTIGEATDTISKIYATYGTDDFIRWYTPTNFVNSLGLWTTSNLTGVQDGHSHTYLYTNNNSSNFIRAFSNPDNSISLLTNTSGGVKVAKADSATTADTAISATTANNATNADKLKGIEGDYYYKLLNSDTYNVTFTDGNNNNKLVTIFCTRFVIKSIDGGFLYKISIQIPGFTLVGTTGSLYTDNFAIYENYRPYDRVEKMIVCYNAGTSYPKPGSISVTNLGKIIFELEDDGNYPNIGNNFSGERGPRGTTLIEFYY